jgi:hypothetical protein
MENSYAAKKDSIDKQLRNAAKRRERLTISETTTQCDRRKKYRHSKKSYPVFDNTVQGMTMTSNPLIGGGR